MSKFYNHKNTVTPTDASSDATTAAFSNGTARVRRYHKKILSNDQLKADNEIEYLRGTAKSDECEPLFREYKACLSVSLLQSPTVGLGKFADRPQESFKGPGNRLYG